MGALFLFAGLLLLHTPGIRGTSQQASGALTAAGLRGVSELKKALNAVNNNVGRKINISRRFKIGDLALNASLRSADVDPYSRAGEQLIPIGLRREGGLMNLEEATASDLIDELKLEARFEINPTEAVSGSVSLDVPKTVDIVGKFQGDPVARDYADFKETIKRVDFLYQHADWVMHGSYNRNKAEGRLEILRQLEDAYVLRGKYVTVTPKLELVFDKSIKSNSNFCLNFKRGKDSITPVIYPLSRKFEFMAEKALTEELKAGIFWSKERRLFVHLSLSLPWGKSGWHTLAFRFVFPGLEKSHVHVTNEVTLN